jgi:hypothetical protein
MLKRAKGLAVALAITVTDEEYNHAFCRMREAEGDGATMNAVLAFADKLAELPDPALDGLVETYEHPISMLTPAIRILSEAMGQAAKGEDLTDCLLDLISAAEDSESTGQTLH